MTVDLTTRELEALYYFIAVYGVRRVPPSLRTAALSGHEKIERACTEALERQPGADDNLTAAEP
jgi:hypothetical protein